MGRWEFQPGGIESWLALVVDILDGQGLALLLLVVHINFDIWRGGRGDGRRRGVRRREGMSQCREFPFTVAEIPLMPL